MIGIILRYDFDMAISLLIMVWIKRISRYHSVIIMIGMILWYDFDMVISLLIMVEIKRISRYNSVVGIIYHDMNDIMIWFWYRNIITYHGGEEYYDTFPLLSLLW